MTIDRTDEGTALNERVPKKGSEAAKPVEKVLNKLTTETEKEEKEPPKIRTSPFRYNY